jgi:4-amino-4-deoxy-L-arabinose transferase-like glycosyltransferase
MYQTGDLLVPRLKGKPHLTKPPLFHWLAYVVSCLRGQASISSVRIVSGLAAATTVLLTYGIGLQLYGPGAALWAGLLALTNLGLLNHGHRGTFDAALAAFVCMAMLGYVLVSRKNRPVGWFLVVAGLSGGFMIKGFMGWLAPLLPMMLDRGPARFRTREFWRSALAVAPVVGILSLAWYAYLIAYVPQARAILQDVVTVNFGVRSSGVKMAFHHEPLLYYLWTTPEVLLPWFFILMPVFLRYRRRWSECWRGPDRLPLVWLGANVLFLSLIPAKAGRYIVPLVPAFSLLGGSVLSYAQQRDGMTDHFWRKWVLGCLIVLGAVGATVLPVWLWVRPGRSLGSSAVASALFVAGVAVCIGLWKRRHTDLSLKGLALLLVLTCFPAYSCWIPRHTALRRHPDQQARTRYEQRKKRLMTLVRLPNRPASARQ